MKPTDHGLSIRDVAVTLAVAALGYLRWTQFVPMITAWSFLLIMLGAMVLANFQEQTFSVLMEAEALYVRFFGEDPGVATTRDMDDGQGEGPGVAERQSAGDGAAAMAPPGAAGSAAERAEGTGAAEGALEFDGEDLEGWVWRGWTIAALIGWLLGGLWRLLFGPSDPWPLRRKLMICALFAGACSVALLAIWGVSEETYHGSAAGWIALFVGVPLAVWLVSAWSLGVSHVLGAFADQLEGSARAPEVAG